LVKFKPSEATFLKELKGLELSENMPEKNGKELL